MLTERQKAILEAVIREYVASAEPVASEHIVRKYRLPASPATVRNELLVLDEAGFLDQPHTSAGRVPTDKGYRFFINHLMGGDGIAKREEAALRELHELEDPVDFVRQASRLFSELTRAFSLSGLPDDELYYKFGIRTVLREPEFSDTRLMHEFSALVDVIEDEFERLFDPAEFAEPKVFIGAENPIRFARHCGMIVQTLEAPSGREGVIALIGPKRMDYQHHLALLKYFHEMLEI